MAGKMKRSVMIDANYIQAIVSPPDSRCRQMGEAYIKPRPEHPSSVLVDLQPLDIDVCQS